MKDCKSFVATIFGFVFFVFSSCGGEKGNDGIIPLNEKEQGVTVSGHIGVYTYVDLGLSVKWATFNVGAEKPCENGYYFAWGETKPKNSFSWGNYKLLNNPTFDEDGFPKGFVRYNDSEYCGTVDNKSFLESSDDAATSNWGNAWRMPTAEEQKELIDNCSWEYTKNFNGCGKAGYLGISQRNGNTIFLPAAGGWDDGEFESYEGYGDYWSSSLDDETYYAINLSFDEDWAPYQDDPFRYDGKSVRAVTK